MLARKIFLEGCNGLMSLKTNSPVIFLARDYTVYHGSPSSCARFNLYRPNLLDRPEINLCHGHDLFLKVFLDQLQT